MSRRRWIGLAGLILLGGFVAFALWYPIGPLDFFRPSITVSKQTTYFTEPLKANGRVDYLGALNRHYGSDIAPEDNAAVLLWQIEHEELWEPMRLKFGKLLGTDLSNSRLYAPLTGERANLPGVDLDDEERTEARSAAMAAPWGEEDYPVIALWLKQNEASLAKAYEAANRPHYHWPLATPRDDVPMIASLFPILNGTRGICSALCARAMLRLHHGDDAGAWSDLMVAFKLGRYLGQTSTLMELWISLNCELTALEGVARYLEHAELSEEQALECLREMSSIPQRQAVADVLGLGERCSLLDSSTYMADGYDETEKQTLSTQFTRAYLVDWDRVLMQIHGVCDLWVAVCRTSPQAQSQLFPLLADDLRRMAGGEGIPDRSSASEPFDASPPLATDRESLIAGAFIGRMFPAVDAIARQESIARQQYDLMKLGLALAAYRARHGGYPASLAELSPDYLKELLRDIFAEADLVYRPSEDGYLLYSVGPDFDDDGGTPRDGRGDEDYDLVLVVEN